MCVYVYLRRGAVHDLSTVHDRSNKLTTTGQDRGLGMNLNRFPQLPSREMKEATMNIGKTLILRKEKPEKDRILPMKDEETRRAC